MPFPIHTENLEIYLKVTRIMAVVDEGKTHVVQQLCFQEPRYLVSK